MAAFDVFNALARNAPLPAELQAAPWVKNGAPLSTVGAGKDLTQELLKLDVLYKRIDMAALQLASNNPPSSLDELDTLEKNAKAAYRSQVVPLAAQALEVKKQAVAVIKLCQTHAALPKTIAVLAVAIGKQAEQLAGDLKDLGPLFKPFDDARKALAKASDLLGKTLKPHLLALKKGLDICLKTPTRDAWDKHCKLPCKAIHNTIKNTAELKSELWDTWKVHDGDAFSHALQVAEKSALKDPKAQQKMEDVITRMCKDLKKEALRVEGFL